jgi:hypothetical protein
MKHVAPIAVLLLALTACGGGATSDTNGSSPAGSPATSATEAGSADGNPVDGPEFCAFLTREAPRLKAVGSAVGAKAAFAIELATWIGEHPAQKPRTATDLDDASQQSCPDTRKAVVASLGATDFDDALS